MQGKHHTEEAKAKISASSKGRKRDPEAVKRGAEKRKMPKEREQAIVQAYINKENISNIAKQFNTSSSSIYRILDRNNIQRLNNFTKWIDRPHTLETREKMSETAKEIWSQRKATNVK